MHLFYMHLLVNQIDLCIKSNQFDLVINVILKQRFSTGGKFDLSLRVNFVNKKFTLLPTTIGIC